MLYPVRRAPSCRIRPRATPSKQNYLPAWSPDGSKLAFTSNRDGNAEIYVMNRDGSGVQRLTNHPSIDVTPTWSPTGTQLAFTSDRSGTPQIYIVNADGTQLQQITRESYCDRPTWSPAPLNEIAYSRALRRRQHHQGLRLRDAQHPRADRQHRQQREPGLLPERPPRRVRLEPRRQGTDLHDSPRRVGTASDHQDGNEPLSALVEVADRRTPRSDSSEMTMHRQPILFVTVLMLVAAAGCKKPAPPIARPTPPPARDRDPTRTGRRRRRRRSRSPGRCRPSRSPRIRSRGRDIGDINKNSPFQPVFFALRQLRRRRARRSRR